MTNPANTLRASSVWSNCSDETALADVARGNREMFEVIVRRYNERLYRVGMAYLRNHALAEDAMQNAYLKAFLHLGEFRGAAAFATWLTRIMINECLTIRRRHRGQVELSLDGEQAEMPSEIPSAPDQATAKDMKIFLEKAIAELPRKYRTVYVLREVQQLTTAETAKCLGRSAASVKVDLHRARARLKTALLKSAAGVELFGYPAQYCDPMTARVMQAVLAAR
ncbi:MAG TPA: sigma-70 family RNA polymerase sigma factor [Opitutaceae bacterium]|nr:sigma-70 family RNA polymerase sigma factor [Opitutaceae bacterium]